MSPFCGLCVSYFVLPSLRCVLCSLHFACLCITPLRQRCESAAVCPAGTAACRATSARAAGKRTSGTRASRSTWAASRIQTPRRGLASLFPDLFYISRIPGPRQSNSGVSSCGIHQLTFNSEASIDSVPGPQSSYSHAEPTACGNIFSLCLCGVELNPISDFHTETGGLQSNYVLRSELGSEALMHGARVRQSRAPLPGQGLAGLGFGG